MKDKEIITIVIVVIAIAVLLSFFGTFTGNNYGYGMMGNMMGNFGFGSMMVFGWIFSILILVALVLFIVWLVKQIQK